MPSLFKRGTSRHKSKFTGNRKLSRARDKAASGGARLGFPVDEPFESIDAVREYLSGDMVLCLICGNAKKSLGNHLRIHGITADAYKAKYGIPFDYGLDGADLIARRAANGREKVEKGVGFHAMTKAERMAASRKAHNALHRVSAGKRLALAARQKYDEADYYRIPALMKQHDMTANEVLATFDVPQRCSFYTKMKCDPALRSEVDGAYAALSFAAQARASRLGKNFRQSVLELRGTGLTYKEIGERLGVDTMSAFNHLNGRVRA